MRGALGHPLVLCVRTHRVWPQVTPTARGMETEQRAAGEGPSAQCHLIREAVQTDDKEALCVKSNTQVPTQLPLQ